MDIKELVLDGLYGDSDGVNMIVYVGKGICLYRFVEAEYNEEIQEYIKTKNERQLTEREVKKLRKW